LQREVNFGVGWKAAALAFLPAGSLMVFACGRNSPLDLAVVQQKQVGQKQRIKEIRVFL